MGLPQPEGLKAVMEVKYSYWNLKLNKSKVI